MKFHSNPLHLTQPLYTTIAYLAVQFSNTFEPGDSAIPSTTITEISYIHTFVFVAIRLFLGRDNTVEYFQS
jgi:hypothetical protein